MSNTDIDANMTGSSGFEGLPPDGSHIADNNPESPDCADSLAVDRLMEMVAELKNTIMYKTAEVENIRRRAATRERELGQLAEERTIVKLLPLLDDLQSANEASRNTDDIVSLRKGFEMIVNRAVRLFEELGVAPLDDATGSEFSVALHEAVMQIPSPLAEGTVVQQIQRGYLLHDKVIRYSKVVTSAGSGDTQSSMEEGDA